uniref:ISXO2-like transposase domain-containing protein n=1 Tax=Panagrolaimus davidi TaxID=227884 RepID=A0A914PC61_9BILA
MEELRNLTNREFYSILSKPDNEFEDFIIKLNILPKKTQICVCGGKMNLRQRGTRGVTYRCTSKNCRKERGRKKNSFFEGSNLCYKDIFELSYLWSHNQASMENVTRCLRKSDGSEPSTKTVVDWKNFFRDICKIYFDKHPIVIGGPGIEVQIDETVVTKRKYHRGRMPATEWWFFGGIEPSSGRAFMLPVQARNRDTLFPLIRRHIAPGSIISSDGWAAYATLGELPEGYVHKTVIHSENFVDPVTGTHTQSIESVWQKFKERHKHEYGTARTLMEQYMIEFLWRREFKEDPFYHLWNQICQKYNFNNNEEDE